MDFAQSCGQAGMDCELHRLRVAECAQWVCMGAVLAGRPQTQGAGSTSAHHPSGDHGHLTGWTNQTCDNWVPAYQRLSRSTILRNYWISLRYVLKTRGFRQGPSSSSHQEKDPKGRYLASAPTFITWDAPVISVLSLSPSCSMGKWSGREKAPVTQL